jgi:hypothetical protein
MWISYDDSARCDDRNKLDHIEEHQFPVWKSGRAPYIVVVRFVINWNPGLATRNAMPNVWRWDEASAYSETLLQIPNSGYIIIRAPMGKIKSNTSYWFNFTTYMCPGGRGGVVVKALCYKPAGRGFDSRFCHWNFSVSNRYEYQVYFLEVKAAGA